MLEVVREVVADVTTRSTSKLVVAKQNDAGSRFLNVRIKDGGKSLDMPNTATVILNAQRPDNSVGTFYGKANDDGTVRVELNSWILEQAGTIACDISVVYENSAKLTTMTFYVEVEAAVASNESIEDTNEYSVIVDLLGRTERAANQAEEAANQAEEAARGATILRENCEEATQEAREVTERADGLVDNLENYYDDALDNMLELQKTLIKEQGIEIVIKRPKAGFIYPLASSVENIPEGFLLCDGKEYLRKDIGDEKGYPELFAAIGTMYNPKDENGNPIDDGIHFNVPNLQTRVPVGAGDGYALGQTGGEEKHTLSVEEMPSHKHRLTDTPNEQTNWGVIHGGYRGSETGYGIDSIGTFITKPVGGDQPHNNMQPYTVVNYIIATGEDTAVSVFNIIKGVQAIPLEVQNGGTGATSAQQARENLGITPENIKALRAIESSEYHGCYYRMVDGEIEWINPPMNVGIEYRTTKRFKSNPVFMQVIDFGSLPNNSEKIINIGVAANQIVDIRGIIDDTPNKAKYPCPHGSFYITSSGNLYYTTKENLSTKSAEFTLSYIKN